MSRAQAASTPAAAGSISRPLSQLIPQDRSARGFDSGLSFRCVISGLLSFLFPTLTCRPVRSTFTTVVHHHDLLDHSSTAWFGASFCTPTPRGLPSSLTTALKAQSLWLSFTSHLRSLPAGASCRVGLSPTRKRRLSTAHARSGHSVMQSSVPEADTR